MRVACACCRPRPLLAHSGFSGRGQTDCCGHPTEGVRRSPVPPVPLAPFAPPDTPGNCVACADMPTMPIRPSCMGMSVHMPIRMSGHMSIHTCVRTGVVMAERRRLSHRGWSLRGIRARPRLFRAAGLLNKKTALSRWSHLDESCCNSGSYPCRLQDHHSAPVNKSAPMNRCVRHHRHVYNRGP